MAAFAKGARDGNIPLRAFFLRDLQSGGLRLPRGGWRRVIKASARHCGFRKVGRKHKRGAGAQ